MGENNNSRLLGAAKRLGRVQELGVGTALVVLILAIGFSTEHFFDLNNLVAIIRAASFTGIMALGMVFVLSGRDVDLSVGGIYNLAGIFTAFLFVKEFPIWFCILGGITVGVLCGLLNIGLSLAFKIPTIIITLGTMSVFRGLGLVLSQARPFYQFEKDNWFFQVVGVSIGKVPTPLIILVVLTLILAVVYGFTVFGTRVRAIGANPEAARFTGINITKNRIFVFMLMGALAALAGVLEVAYLQTSSPSMGSGSELMVIAAAIIGGTALSGGSGSIIGAFIGTLLIMTIRNGIVHLGVSAYWSATVTGFVIIAAVAVDYLFKRARKAV
jgi:ribose transport system permease protein